MIRVGIVGIGFMGKMHFRCYKALENVTLAAVCDADESKFTAAAGKAGNIETNEEPLDFTNVAFYTDFDKMLAEANLDAVSITLPTKMHKDFTIKALNAGLNVLCEKPMTRSSAECEEIIDAAEKSGKTLLIGHCIRFWPEYVKTKEIIDSGEYGRVIAATFRRLSLPPTWSWQGWMTKDSESGGPLLDMHIHDSDYIHYVFGMPKAVYCRAAKGPMTNFDHTLTQYIYDNDSLIAAEGSWAMAPGFGFEMSFNIVLEKATIVYDCTRQPAFKIHICDQDEPMIPEILPGDGYSNEIDYFVKLVAGETLPEITNPRQSRDSIKLVEAEKESAQKGTVVEIN